MDITSAQIGDALVAQVGDKRIDASVSVQFKDRMKAVSEESSTRIILDLGNVEFIDSSGLGAVVSVMKLLGQDRKLELAQLQPVVAKVFKLTRMDSVFNIHDTVDAALGQAARSN